MSAAPFLHDPGRMRAFKIPVFLAVIALGALGFSWRHPLILRAKRAMAKSHAVAPHVTALAEADVPPALAAQGPTVMEVGATWCPACQRLAPIFHDRAAKNASARFVSIDIDLAPKARERLHVGMIPVVAIFACGKEIGRAYGAMDAAALDRWLDHAIPEAERRAKNCAPQRSGSSD